MSIDHNTLDIIQLRVVLKSAHVQASFLTELGNARPVVVAEHPICQDCISHIGKCDQIDLQHLVR